MTDKEQIIIDGEKYNKCNGCKLWDGYICTGDRSYEPNAEAHRDICNEHMAKEFWKVYHELFYKTQECEELKSKNSILKKSLKPFQDEYFKNLETIVIAGLAKKSIRITAENTQLRKALEEIEEIVKSLNENRMCFYDDINDCSNCDMNTDCNYLRKSKILDIINEAKGNNND